MENVSVLMSLYAKERPEPLKESLESIWAQTCRPAEIVLVIDGPIGRELAAVVSGFEQRSASDPGAPRFITVKLPANVGLGRALNEGLRHCSHAIVARMDTDDICVASRFEKQLEVMKSRPEISLCGTWIDEFIGSPNNIVSTRRLPENPAEIAEYAKARSPVNHPTVMFRKEDVIRAGGYMHFPLFEDYHLWIRMLSAGMKFCNIPESLLLFRASDDMYGRRGGWKYARTCMRLQKYMHSIGFIGFGQAISNSLIRGTVYLLPGGMRKWFYRTFLRK